MEEEAVTEHIGPWDVRFTWPKGATQGGPTRLEIVPGERATTQDLAGGISQTVLRQINFRHAFMVLQLDMSDLQPTSLQDELDTRARSLRRMLADGVTDVYLATLSETYLLLIQTGEKNVAGKLAEMVDRTPSGVLQQLKRARKAELLTSIPGRAGGQLTPKAEEILTKDGD
ncbi:hypothetical protein NN3_21770 [Nocardia neocaledoniensis NBRC 108232]|nr:hypothetical protein [Nocardia neocaledoniensis]GEM31170.1 hypothetical protein NN3_21770 [Nocardia neocaledoniensis NBRC 108232]